MAPALCFRGITFRYGDDAAPVLSGLDFSVEAGEIVAVVGGNGSGKSTLARLANGLLLPQEGEVRVGGHSTADHARQWEIHARVGLLFQDPDDQIVGATVEDDIAFGLENLGVPRDEMLVRVARVMCTVGLEGEGGTEPHLLSGGQKQRLALAGVLVLEPAVLVLDEPTSMLDPAGRAEVMSAARSLAARGVAVVMITQHMEETLLADRLIALRGGSIEWAGPPDEFFSSGAHEGFPLGVPAAMDLWRDLEARLSPRVGPREPVIVVSENDVVAALEVYRGKIGSARSVADGPSTVITEPLGGSPHPDVGRATSAVRLEGVCMTYNRGTPFARAALTGVTLDIAAGAVTAVVGATASGKSSLLQVMAGVMQPSQGRVFSGDGGRVRAGGFAMALQRPEVQLFCATVWDDVAVAPRLHGLAGEALRRRVEWAMEVVGLDPEAFGARGPYTLSVGEQRRVALAGVLSLDPAVLVLDEPGSGLDPAARRRLMERLVEWARGGVASAALSQGKGAAAARPQGAGVPAPRPQDGGVLSPEGLRTLVFTSHDLDEVAARADRVVVLHRGRVEAHGAVEQVLGDVALLRRVGLRPTLTARVAERFGFTGPGLPATPAALAQWLEETVPGSGRPDANAGRRPS